MTNCCVLDFHCAEADLCKRCTGTGDEPDEDLCQKCDRCFDEVLGWSTGIEPGTESQQRAREFVAANNRGY